MDITPFAPDQLPTVFRVLRSALRPDDGLLDERERRFLVTYARIAGFRLGDDDPAPIAAGDVGLGGLHQRKRLVQLAALAALFARPVRPESAAFVAALARRLHVRDSAVDVVQALAEGRPGTARRIVLLRAMPALLRDNYRAGGIAGVLRFYAALLLRVPVNRNRRDAFKRLGLLPEGTLGREFWKHQAERGFGMPGEPGGIPAAMAYHDVAHVLTGHDTDPAGEIQQGAFQAGSRRDDGIFFLLFVVLQFHHGQKLTPAAAPEVGFFEPEPVLWALHRGASCRVDVTRGWDYWPLMALPLAEARARCGLLPPLLVASRAA